MAHTASREGIQKKGRASRSVSWSMEGGYFEDVGLNRHQRMGAWRGWGVWFLSKEIQGKVHGGMETAVTATAYSE